MTANAAGWAFIAFFVLALLGIGFNLGVMYQRRRSSHTT